jgi:hypothetical protein
MSNENKNENEYQEYQEYQDYEFCKDVKCRDWLKSANCCCPITDCNYSAKEFHIWLNNNGYKIVKCEQDEQTNNQKPFEDIKIITSYGFVASFIGRYRRDLEVENWHYYETATGRLVHFRKEHMIAVLEGDNVKIEMLNS